MTSTQESRPKPMAMMAASASPAQSRRRVERLRASMVSPAASTG
jgi:hypothetical protein